MNIASDLIKGGITGILNGAGDFATKIRTAITGKSVLTADQLAEIEKITLQQQAEIRKYQYDMDQAIIQFDTSVATQQAEINKIEAQSSSLFKGGWRPAIGWICCCGLGYTFLLQPLIPWIVGLFKAQVAPLPSLDTSTLMTLLLGMLGLGGMRSYEKVKKLTK